MSRKLKPEQEEVSLKTSCLRQQHKVHLPSFFQLHLILPKLINTMDRAVRQWLSASDASEDTIVTLIKKLNKSYTIYGAMLLLPPTAITGPEWINANLEPNENLYESICKHLKVTNIAVNKPIPLHSEPTSSEPATAFNALRSPSNFLPLHGDFGPSTSAIIPTKEDFARAFWVTAKQNGIYQTWAPRWTMFSRGNISEKARLLALPSVLTAASEPSTAVDLYAGIGYFAFSYAKAGIQKVLCWDLNAWSCEGLVRGAKKNKWKARIVGQDDGHFVEAARADGMKLMVFNESNEHAPMRVKELRKDLPPIRHVNCGMLPNDRSSLEIAAKVLDLNFVGWVHFHENFLVEEIEKKAQETRNELSRILESLFPDVGTFAVEVEHINRLKNYAPGVMHCVVDLRITPNETTIPPSYVCICPVFLILEACNRLHVPYH